MAEFIVYGYEDWVSSVIISELVRCKDCKHCQDGMYGVRCEYMGVYTEEDNFCKWGERADDVCGKG